jgi:hypothetical protein
LTSVSRYCVRPNSGRVEPGKEVEVTGTNHLYSRVQAKYNANLLGAVLLQAMKQEPPLDAKCRDKFLVQSVAVTADKEFTNIASIVRMNDAGPFLHILIFGAVAAC